MSIWSDYLARSGATIEPGTFTVHFGNPQADAETLARGAVVVPLRHLDIILATGDEAAVFLNNLLSSDVVKLPVDAAQWTSFNTAQGRMLANFLLWRDDNDNGNGYSLALAADLAPALLKKLSFYILRTKVKLALPTPERVLIGLAGATASDTLTRAALPVPAAGMRQAHSDGRRVIRIAADPDLFIIELAATDAPTVFDALCLAGATESSTASWQLATIRAGLPLITAATQEAFVAQMLNFELIGGVSFTKGCYPGQEIVARTQHLGKIKRRLYRLALSTPPAAEVPPGTALYAPEFGGQATGAIVNFAPLPEGGEALAVIQTSCANAGGEIYIGTPDGPRAQVLGLPYEVPQ
jgi:folate-binding protein YgfZ